MKLSIDTIKDALYDWAELYIQRLNLGTTVNIVWREQSAPLPQRPCVGLRIISGPNRVGSFDDNLDTGDDETWNVAGQRTMMISVQVFGDTRTYRPIAYQLATDLHGSLSLITVLERLYGSGIAVFNIDQVNAISQVEESEYEERAQFDFTIGVAENVEDQPGVIETVEPIPGNYNP